MALSGFALAVLVIWTQPFAHVGESAGVLMHKLGIDPLAPFANPVYGWVVGLLALVSGSSAVYAVNLFSAVCAAGVLWLVFQYVYRFTLSLNTDRDFTPTDLHRIQLTASILSVLYLLASTPFVMAATRANPILFDLLLIMSAFYLVIFYTASQPSSRLIIASVLYGITMVDFTTAIILLPLFSILMLVKMWQAGTLTTRLVAMTVGGGLVGLSLYLVQAGYFMTTKVYEWREFRGFWQAVWYILVEQKQNLTGGLPRTGWLTLSLVSFVPWLITVTSGFRFSRGGQHKPGALIGTMAINAVFGVLAVLLLLRNFPLSPENVAGTVRLFVSPHVFIALWIGNVSAFWLSMFSRERRFEKPFMRTVRRGLRYAIYAAFPVFLFYTIAAESFPKSRDPADRLVHEFARTVVDQAADRKWLISATPIDDQIAIEAGMRKLPLKVVRIAYGKSPVYMKYLASLLDDNPRLQSLAHVGMSPLLDEWFYEMPNVTENTLVVPMPDVWLMAGFDAIPDRVAFAGVKQGTALPLDELLARNRAYWNDYGSRVLDVRVAKDSLPGMALGWIRNHLSKIANNLGVYLEDQGRVSDAYDCYKESRRLLPDNLSALMNLHVVAQKNDYPEYPELEAELKKATENLMGRVQAWSLSQLYGFVRVPELFANRGIAFAMSGKATMAISDMKRALALDKQNPQVQLALANLYFGQSKDIESSEQFETVLATDPSNIRALLGMMRISVRNNRFDEARQYLDALRKTEVNPLALKMEEAVLESMSGNPESANKLLRSVVEAQPDNLTAWAAIAINAAQMNDKSTSEEALKKLDGSKVLNPNIQMLMARSALDQGDKDTARRHLSSILRAQPGNIPALEMSLRMDLFEGNRDLVKLNVERLLNVDPRNALANYLLGVDHFYKQEYALAEAAYRASLATERSTEALNDLAYVMYVQGNMNEAETLVRESLKLNDRNSSAWDTLGAVLIELNKLEDAEVALQRSLSLRPNVANVQLNLALLYEKSGRTDQAIKVANDINARLNELSPQDQARLKRLLDRLNDQALVR